MAEEEAPSSSGRKRRRKSRSSRHSHESSNEDGEEEKAVDTVMEASDGDAKVETEAVTKNDDSEQATTKPKRKRKRKRKSKAATEEKDTEEDVKKLTSLEHTVYIEGIPFECTEDEVRDFFASNGVEDILQLRLPRWQDSGRLRGYGHVVLASESSRTKALKDVSGKNMKTRYITIKEARNPKPDTSMGAASARPTRPRPMGCATVFCKNLPYDATEEDLHEAFSVCGKIVEGGIRVARNYQTRQSKGFAYVEYKNPEGAEAAVQKASKPFGLCIMGRPCFVDYEEQKMKGSFKTKDGRLWSREFKRNVHTERRR